MLRLGLLLLAGACACALYGQDSKPAVTVRLDRAGAPLYVTIGGGERKIADAAEKAWVLRNGTDVVYSGKDGAGGYDNEGQSLYLYDTRTGNRTKLMAEYYIVDNVKETSTSNGRSALIVEMLDNNIDASHVAVVDPARGEVFCEDGAKLAGMQGDTITLAFYGDDDWDNLHDNPNIAPRKTEQHDLRKLLDGPVMNNAHQ